MTEETTNMTPNQYQILASKTENRQEHALIRMGGLSVEEAEKTMDKVGLEPLSNDSSMLIRIRVTHGIIGLIAETGELASLLEKEIWYGREFKLEELRLKYTDELGDVCWRLAEIMNAMGIEFQEVLEGNIAKLKIRFPKGYEQERTKEENRDREAEAKAVQDTLEWANKHGISENTENVISTSEIPAKGAKNNAMEILGDGRCNCNCGEPCPLGRMGMQIRCTRKELQSAGFHTVDIERRNPLSPENQV